MFETVPLHPIYLSQQCGIGPRIDIDTIGVELNVQKETHTFLINSFLTEVPKPFNGERIAFSKGC